MEPVEAQIQRDLRDGNCKTSLPPSGLRGGGRSIDDAAYGNDEDWGDRGALHSARLEDEVLSGADLTPSLVPVETRHGTLKVCRGEKPSDWTRSAPLRPAQKVPATFGKSYNPQYRNSKPPSYLYSRNPRLGPPRSGRNGSSRSYLPRATNSTRYGDSQAGSQRSNGSVQYTALESKHYRPRHSNLCGPSPRIQSSFLRPSRYTSSHQPQVDGSLPVHRRSSPSMQFNITHAGNPLKHLAEIHPTGSFPVGLVSRDMSMEDYTSNVRHKSPRLVDQMGSMPSTVPSPSGSSYSNAIGLIPLSSSVLASFADRSNSQSLPGHSYTRAIPRSTLTRRSSPFKPVGASPKSPTPSDGIWNPRRSLHSSITESEHAPTSRTSKPLVPAAPATSRKSHHALYVCNMFDALHRVPCHQQFTQHRRLRRHEVEVHKTHRCHVIVPETGKLCDARFHFGHSLKLHMARMHMFCAKANPRTGVGCNKAFSTPHHYTVHMNEVHGVVGSGKQVHQRK